MVDVNFTAVLPEIILALYAMAALIGAVYTGKDEMTRLLTWATVVVFLVLAAWIGLSRTGAGLAFDGAIRDDAFAKFGQVTVLLAAAGVLAMSEEFMRRQNLARFEYPILITFAVIGMMVMVSAGDLMSLYMGLELQSLSLYVVASQRRDSVKSTEAGLK
jgi:NADH-quinone oxidoreductase subunit N